jgi:hypothetical protein
VLTHKLILKNKSKFAECIDWCEDNLRIGTWDFSVNHFNSDPFDPTLIFSFRNDQDRLLVGLKFS